MADQDDTLIVISRKEAKARGLKRYFTGRSCKRGHIVSRLVTNMGCRECQRIALGEARKRKTDYVRRRDREWKNKNRERLLAVERRRYAKNPEKYRAKTRRQYQANGEIIRAKQKVRHQRTYDAVAKKKALERSRRWVANNRERYRARLRNAKAKRKSAPGTHTADDIAAIFKAQRGKCAICGVKLGKKQHVDHIVAIANGGPNIRTNLQITHPACNLAKGARDPIDHMRSLGRLL
jgi:5-methylcytosine-specific restriction endonuclease McrA